jgi:hypothetical protein
MAYFVVCHFNEVTWNRLNPKINADFESVGSVDYFIEVSYSSDQKGSVYSNVTYNVAELDVLKGVLSDNAQLYRATHESLDLYLHVVPLFQFYHVFNDVSRKNLRAKKGEWGGRVTALALGLFGSCFTLSSFTVPPMLF